MHWRCKNLGSGILALMLFAPGLARAQGVRWAVDGKASLATWEIRPKSNKLRATTCPEDPSWEPSEGSDHASSAEARFLARERGARIRASCTEAVGGVLQASDTGSWSDVHGTVRVSANRLVTGLGMRDEYARRVLLETIRFPEIQFSIDSLQEIQRGDTLRALAAGIFELRGVRQPMTVPVQAWREGGALRVTAQFEIPARDLVERYGMSKYALGLAVKQGLWKAVGIRLDVSLRDTAAALTATR